MGRVQKAVIATIALLSPAIAMAQGRALTIDDLYDPPKRIDFAGGAPSGLAWMTDTDYIWPKPGTDGVEWMKVDAATGQSAPLFDAAKMRAAFDALPGLRAEDVARLPNSRGLEMNALRTAALVSIGDDLYYYPFAGDRAFRLTFDPDLEEEYSFSPDGRMASFVRANNLYVINVEQQRQERKLTTDGGPQLLNGKLDWVYEEELYGRGNRRGYWWSPDSVHLSFLQLNEVTVPEFTVVDHLPRRLVVETWDYPKAGDQWSDLNTPPQVRVHRADNSQVRVVHESRIEALAQFTMSKPEPLQVKTRDGFVMEAILIKPANFNPSRKYPVMQFTYGGPSAPQVRNAWYGQSMMYYQLLAQRGIAVWICDNRSASGKGMQSTWAAYKNLGVSELADIEDGLTWLKSQPWVDGARIGIDGWSYGGFMTTYALTHSTSFAMGIGGGNVTDWALYDSIYTERYMLMPQNNPEGYERTSVLKAAKNLHGQLLLIHGVIDDNVHMQNTMSLAYELQKAGKPFRLMVYEKSRHGVVDPDLVKHMRQMMLDFTMETLLKPASPAASTAQ